MAKETEEAVKELDKQSELLSHPESIPIPLEEALKGRATLLAREEQTLKSEMALKQLKEKLDKLKEKLKEYKDPKTRSDLIAEIVVEDTAVADAEKTIKKAYEAIGRFEEAFDKFKEYYSRDDIRKMVQEEYEREWEEIRRRSEEPN